MIEIDGLYFNKLFEEYNILEKIIAKTYRVRTTIISGVAASIFPAVASANLRMYEYEAQKAKQLLL